MVCLGSPAADGVCCAWLRDAMRWPTDEEVWQLWRRGVLLRLSSGFCYCLTLSKPLLLLLLRRPNLFWEIDASKLDLGFGFAEFALEVSQGRVRETRRANASC